MKIYLVRHGITELNKKKVVNGQIDEPLSPEGVKQVAEAIPLLPQTIKHIYVSPLTRATQTAEIINTSLQRQITVQPELSEIHMGSLAGSAWTDMENGSELKKKHRSMQFDYTPFGGESVDQVTERVVSFLKNINGKYNDFEILLITHGGVIRLLTLLETGEPLTEELEHITLLTFDLDKILT